MTRKALRPSQRPTCAGAAHGRTPSAGERQSRSHRVSGNQGRRRSGRSGQTGQAHRTPGSDYLALLPPGSDAVRRLPLHGAWPEASVASGVMPDDARRALLGRFFDHAPMFPPARLPPAEALAEDRRARESEHAWMLGRLVWPADLLDELAQEEHRAFATVSSDGEGKEWQGEAIYIEGRSPEYVASLGVRAKIRCGGERVPSVEEL